MCNFLNIYFFQGILQGLKQFVLLFIEAGFISTILSKINFISSKFLLSAICSLIFLQSKGGKRQALWIENTKSFVSCFAIIFSIKTALSQSEVPSRLQKEKRRSAKSYNSEGLFPDKGKMTNLVKLGYVDRMTHCGMVPNRVTDSIEFQFMSLRGVIPTSTTVYFDNNLP